MRSEVARVLAVLAAVLGARGAGAAAPGFHLEQRDCAALDGEALRELVELELRTLSLSDSGTRVAITCDGDTATISLADDQGRPFPVESRVDFARTGPGARERLVALSATELVAQAERAAESARRAAAASAPAPSAAPRRARSEGHDGNADGGTGEFGTRRASPRLEMSLAGVGTVTGSPTTLLAGGELGARVGVAGPWALALDARFQGGARDTASARVGWTMLGAGAAVVLGLGLSPGGVRVDVGAGVRAARLALHADTTAPDRGRDVAGVWFGPLLCARAAFDLGTRVAVLTLVEGGHVTLPVRGTLDGGEVIVDAAGAWASLGLGVAARF